MSDDDRTAAALLLLAAALLAWWLWGKRDTPERRGYTRVPPLGDVPIPPQDEFARDRYKFGPPEGWNDEVD